jgi:hypothetical protein
MHTQLQSTVPSRLSRNNYRTTARILGVLYLAGWSWASGGTYSFKPFLVRRITFRRFPRTACCWLWVLCSG